MANIKLKPISELETWNMKELRKLRITVNNRIQTLTTTPKAKELPEGHPLHAMEIGECQSLILEIKKAEKQLCK